MRMTPSVRASVKLAVQVAVLAVFAITLGQAVAAWLAP